MNFSVNLEKRKMEMDEIIEEIENLSETEYDFVSKIYFKITEATVRNKEELIKYFVSINRISQLKGYVTADIFCIKVIFENIFKRFEQVRALNPQSDEEFAVMFKLLLGGES